MGEHFRKSSVSGSVPEQNVISKIVWVELSLLGQWCFPDEQFLRNVAYWQASTEIKPISVSVFTMKVFTMEVSLWNAKFRPPSEEITTRNYAKL